MICYKDQSFCAAQDKCGTEPCFRKLTERDRAICEQHGMPISLLDFSTACEDFMEVKKNVE